MVNTASNSFPVVVSGALGRMGSEVIKAVHSSHDCHLIGAIDTAKEKVQYSNVKVAAVSSYFPSGQVPMESKLLDTK